MLKSNRILALDIGSSTLKIAEFAASGASASEIGRALDISADTVRDHLKQIYAMVDVGSRVELAECLRTLGLPLSN